FSATTSPQDTTPPTVAITAPAGGTTVSGTVTVTASASDNVSVTGVQLQLDGVNLGSEITSAPYSIDWSTIAVSNGAHSLSAIARDLAGNIAMSAAVGVTVSNSGGGTPAQVGQWSSVLTWPLVAIHAVLLPNGQVLAWDGAAQGGAAFIWYPTAIVLPDGRVVVMAGETTCEGCTADIPEIYDPAANTWTQLSAAALSLPEYPHLYVLADGRILVIGSFEAAIPTSVLDLNSLRWTVVDPTVLDGQSSAMYLPGKFVKSGTSATSDPPFVAAAATTYVLDMNQPNPAWRQTAPMTFPRAYHNMVLLDRKSVV